MAKNINIRPAVSADLKSIWKIWQEVVRQKTFFAYDDSYSQQQIEATWINLQNTIGVADINGQVLGAYIIRPNQPTYGAHIANASYLVSTTARGQGLGRKLCAHSIEAARAAGYRGMQFNLVVSTNVAAIKIWKEYGFDIIGTTPGGFYHPEQGYVDTHIFFRSLL